MFSPYVWIAALVGGLVACATSFGVGYHYGEKNTVPVKTYEAVVKQLATDQAALQEARDTNVRDAKALVAGTAQTERDVKDAHDAVDVAEAAAAKAIKERVVSDTTLATTRRVLDAISAENKTRAANAGAAASAIGDGTAQPTDIAGRLNSCESTHTSLLTSSLVNNSELKRAIVDRDGCVVRYNDVKRRINGE